MRSKSRSRLSANIRACRHIGTGQSVNWVSLPRGRGSDDCVDAPDFYESSWWKDSDPVSGLGGWGDPNNDYAVPDGGFNKLPLSYPSPHTVRRNFTLLPYNVQFNLFTDHLKIGNSSFSASVIEAILATPAGDYKGFHTMLEAPEVI